jgi:transposase
MEARRFKAAAMLRRNVSQADVARQLAVSRTTASRWANLAATPNLLKARKTPGRPCLLPFETVRAIWATRSRWTGISFVAAIAAATGVQYDPDHGNRLLRRLRGPVLRKAGAR